MFFSLLVLKQFPLFLPSNFPFGYFQPHGQFFVRFYKRNYVIISQLAGQVLFIVLKVATCINQKDYMPRIQPLRPEEHFKASETPSNEKLLPNFKGSQCFQFKMKNLKRMGQIAQMPKLLTQLDCEYSVRDLLKQLKLEENKSERLDKQLIQIQNDKKRHIQDLEVYASKYQKIYGNADKELSKKLEDHHEEQNKHKDFLYKMFHRGQIYKQLIEEKKLKISRLNEKILPIKNLNMLMKQESKMIAIRADEAWQQYMRVYMENPQKQFKPFHEQSMNGYFSNQTMKDEMMTEIFKGKKFIGSDYKDLYEQYSDSDQSLDSQQDESQTKEEIQPEKQESKQKQPKIEEKPEEPKKLEEFQYEDFYFDQEVEQGALGEYDEDQDEEDSSQYEDEDDQEDESEDQEDEEDDEDDEYQEESHQREDTDYEAEQDDEYTQYDETSEIHENDNFQGEQKQFPKISQTGTNKDEKITKDEINKIDTII